jgi:hypothetical protein
MLFFGRGLRVRPLSGPGAGWIKSALWFTYGAMPTLDEAVGGLLAINIGQRNAMMSAVASREAIAFIGSGLSIPLGYPSWNGLLDELSTDAQGLGGFQSVAQGVLLRAEEIKRHFQSKNAIHQYYAVLGRKFKECRAGYTPTHLRVVRLPFRGFVTTNYEPCVECALMDYAFEIKARARSDASIPVSRLRENRHLLSIFLRSISQGFDPKERYVAHLHGFYTDPAGIILADSDYKLAYGINRAKVQPEATIHRQFLWAMLATRRVVFVGFSLDDPHIQALVETVCSDLWEWNVGNHFVVLPLDRTSIGEAAALQSRFARYGIEPVFYDNLKGDFANLDRLLDDMVQFSQGTEILSGKSEASGPTLSVGADRMAASPGDILDPAWLEPVNDKAVKDLESK